MIIKEHFLVRLNREIEIIQEVGGEGMSILVTGGAGYIGSHTCLELLEAGYDVVVIDDLSNSKYEAITRVEQLTGKKLTFYEATLLEKEKVADVFEQHSIEAVIHLAGLKAVGESVAMPLRYYHNNITGTLMLCEVMAENNVRKFVFSSSATVYGVPTQVPLVETDPLHATNPYGRTKLMIEEILRDLAISDDTWSIALLRYFNPIGAHRSGEIGEDPNGIPNNLMPYITKVASGELPQLSVYGNDYDTSDGTGVRDYLHVVDLAKGHIKALEKVMKETGVDAYNLGTGKGYSVLELLAAFQEASGQEVPYQIVARRPGDIASCYASPAKAESELGWTATRGIEEMCRDAWRWQQTLTARK
jgi:UDP-glucose 4-epimerase